MTETPPMLERFVRLRIIQRLLSAIGIEPRQFLIFLRLLRTLSERQEFMGNLGVNRFAIAYLALFYMIFFGLPMGLLALAGIAAPVYLLVNISVTTLVLLLLIMGEAANTLFNPIEASILTHLPVHAFTYVASKIAHLLLIVLYVVPALAGPAALCGLLLHDARAAYPLTHLTAALLAGLFVAFMMCAVYGLLFRLLPAASLKSVSLWLQVLVFAAMPAIGGAMGVLLASLRRFEFDVTHWAWLPLSWFVAMGLLGTRVIVQQVTWLVPLSIGLTAVMIWLGLRGFSKEYLQQAPAMIRERTGRGRWGGAAPSRIAPLIRFVTGAPEGVAAFGFTSRLIRRDWQFRRSTFQVVLGAALWMLLPLFAKRDLGSPLGSHQFSPAYVLPVAFGLMLLMACAMIAFTDWHQGSWIFLTAPLGRLGPFSRGIYAALWFPGVAVPQAITLLLTAWIWGWTAAALFTFFNLAAVSFYLALEMLLITGLPFANAPKASRSAFGVPVMIVGGMIAGALAGLQWLVFQIWWVTLGTGFLLALAAWLVAHQTLRQVEDEIRLNLQALRMGPTKMFKEMDDW